MKNLRRASFVVAALAGAAGSLCVGSVGCSNDDTGVVTDDGGGKDVKVGDAGHIDAKQSHEASSDAGVDSGFDSTVDSGTDTSAPIDTGVDSHFDSGMDASQEIAAYPLLVTTAYCQRLAQCCTSASVPISVDDCVSLYEPNGGAIANLATAVATSGHLTYNASAASDCLTRINAIDCDSVDSAENIQLTNACAAGLKGTLSVGGTGCLSSWDCMQPAYCATPGATTGVCTALLPTGAACTDIVYSEDCNPLGNAIGNFCGPNGATEPKCLAAEDDGGACEENNQCASTICNLEECAGGFPFATGGDGGTCGYFVPLPDAGPDAAN
jgi:hypothetical protein